jgi:hypothetical protein
MVPLCVLDKKIELSRQLAEEEEQYTTHLMFFHGRDLIKLT